MLCHFIQLIFIKYGDMTGYKPNSFPSSLYHQSVLSYLNTLFTADIILHMYKAVKQDMDNSVSLELQDGQQVHQDIAKPDKELLGFVH